MLLNNCVYIADYRIWIVALLSHIITTIIYLYVCKVKRIPKSVTKRVYLRCTGVQLVILFMIFTLNLLTLS